MTTLAAGLDSLPDDSLLLLLLTLPGLQVSCRPSQSCLPGAAPLEVLAATPAPDRLPHRPLPAPLVALRCLLALPAGVWVAQAEPSSPPRPPQAAAGHGG